MLIRAGGDRELGPEADEFDIPMSLTGIAMLCQVLDKGGPDSAGADMFLDHGDPSHALQMGGKRSREGLDAGNR
jgi:hypothetical protein